MWKSDINKSIRKKMGAVLMGKCFPAKYSVEYEHALIYRKPFALETNAVTDCCEFKSGNM